MTYEQARTRLSEIGQEHILKYYEELKPEQQKELLKQIDADKTRW